MYCYRLWIELSETTDESDCGGLGAKVEELQTFINEKLTCIREPKDCIFHVNYAKVLQCCGGANHRGRNHDALLEVVRFIVDRLPGSHGLVYWSDDEDRENDGYRVIVIARGEFYERADPFLSLKISTVED